MKRLLVLILCFAFLPNIAAFAQQSADAATKEDVQRLFELTQSRKQIDAMMAAMKQQLPTIVIAEQKRHLPNAAPEEIAQLEAFTAQMSEKMFQNMPLDEMMQAMIPPYQRHFTHAEIQQLIEFYTSPIGNKMITELPAITSEGMQAMMPIMMKWMEKQQAELKASADEYAKTLKQREKKSAAPTR